MTDDDGDTNPRRYEAFWAFRNRWLMTNHAKAPERCMTDDGDCCQCFSCRGDDAQ